MRGPTVTERERIDRATRHYRDAIREMVRTANEALAHQGAKRETALSDIGRIGNRALQEG